MRGVLHLLAAKKNAATSMVAFPQLLRFEQGLFYCSQVLRHGTGYECLHVLSKIAALRSKSDHLPHASAQSTVCSRNEFFVMILNDSRNLYEYPKVRNI
jgi:hypothetical protein